MQQIEKYSETDVICRGICCDASADRKESVV